ncbi:alpha/beta fold hydrolase [Psychromarinibacter sp. C21-152]|uniref:Alpha/beta fold hydrolase n=1 Tax=Psychromarinibacter sediminicola TaxID=3033385 RepID=A0AAE3NRS1_9RHOB|nr:alpha/beta hydrolase [Psychromarinibacter sediminicola]MDF0600449.1 alpha/beta fold hydrolase [Psychromarinibacter sediminicola]
MNSSAEALRVRRHLSETSFGHLHWREAGAGPPVVLLHANQQSSALWLEMMAALAPGMRAVAPDYPSHGASDHIDWQPTIADYARAVVEVMDAAGVARAAVLGEATGAAVALEISKGWPERVDWIALVNCPVNRGTPEEILAPFKAGYRPADPSGFGALRTVEWMLENDPKHAPLHPTVDWMDRVNRAQIECGRNRWQALTALAQYPMLEGLRAARHPVQLFTTERFYFRERLPEIVAALGERLAEAHDLAGGRVCAGWECAGEIGAKVLDFGRRRQVSEVGQGVK